MNRDETLARVAEILDSTDPPEARLLRVLDSLLADFDCVTGTIHRLDPADGMLHLIAQRGIPPVIMDKVTLIPIGKGMAGLAAERMEPVQVCNLQSDDSGVAKPGARQTRMEGSIALPMLADGRLVGTLGVAKPTEYEFSAGEQALLLEAGERISRALAAD